MSGDPASRSEIRAKIRKRRNALSACQQQVFAHKLCEQLKYHTNVISAKKVGLYLANDGELDPMPFIEWCWQQNKEVYLPVLHPFCPGYLVFLRYCKSTKMTLNQFNIPEPKLAVTQLCPINQLDLLFTPLVAFNKQGDRMGMGGGFYDRTLAQWFSNNATTQNTDIQKTAIQKTIAQKTAIENTTIQKTTIQHTITQPTQTATNSAATLIPIGLAHDCQEVKTIPTEHWDIPLPYIITPTRIISSTS